jgi:hypothetical protein
LFKRREDEQVTGIGFMRRWIVIGLLLWPLTACASSQEDTTLPTLAVLPSITPEVPRPLEFWESVSDTLTSTGQIHRWEFDGQRGDPIRLRVISRGAATTLTLREPDGDTLATGDNLELSLPFNGVYTVVAQLTQDGVGSYELGLSYTDRPNPLELPPTQLPQVVGVPTPTPAYADLGTFVNILDNGETIGAIFDESSFHHVYTFNGAAGQVVNISSSRVSGSVDPLLTLYGPEGVPLALDDNSGGGTAAQLTNIELPQDGLYSIQVSSKTFTGSYQVGLRVNNQPQPVTPSSPLTPTATSFNTVLNTLTPTVPTQVPGNRLEDHVQVMGEIEPSSDIERFPIFAAAGERITVTVRLARASALQPKMEIYGPAGDLIAAASSLDSPRIDHAVISFQAATTGAYIVFVSSENSSTGRFLVSYGSGNSSENVLKGQAFPDQPALDYLRISGYREVWSIQLNRDDIITAAVSAVNSSLDPVLDIATPDGTVLAVDDNGGGGTSALIQSFRAPETGTYLLRVTSANAASVGDYQLIWRFVNVAPTNTPMPNTYRILTVVDTAPENEYLFYPFQGQAGDQVNIEVRAGEGTGLDPVAVLIAPDGTEIAQGDDSLNDLNPRFSAELPIDGTYNVRVNGYLSSGAFRLIIDKSIE